MTRLRQSHEVDRDAYGSFLKSKRQHAAPLGFDTPLPISEALYDFQAHIVEWALTRGRAALFEDCGLGKTPQQLEWAKHVCAHTGKPALILAPLAVAEQTQREGVKFDIPANICRSQDDVQSGVNISNYEMLGHFDPSAFGGIVLDESSILKNYGGYYRKQLVEFAEGIQFRLAATATPAPNDWIELLNHADFLDVMTSKEALALYFIQDGNSTHKWRLKRHAESDFWRWLASWSVAIQQPSDLGYEDRGYRLPGLHIYQHTVEGNVSEGFLFPIEAHTLHDRRKARRESLDRRVGQCAELINANDRPWIAWCDLNAESEALARAISDAVEVKGSDSREHKIDAMTGFSEGRYRVIVSKPSICGFGMNWQHCGDMAFVGLSDSWEQFYQAIRRCYRFGRTGDVHVHLVVSECEGAVVENIQRKERQAHRLMQGIIQAMRESHHAFAQ